MDENNLLNSRSQLCDEEKYNNHDQSNLNHNNDNDKENDITTQDLKAIAHIQLQKFNKFINYRGIKRVKVSIPSPSSLSSDEADQQRLERSYRARLLQSSSDNNNNEIDNDNDDHHNSPNHTDEYIGRVHGSIPILDIENFDINMDDDRITDYFGLTRDEDNPDADEFYRERRESFNSNPSAINVLNDDKIFNDIIDNDNSEQLNSDREFEYIAFQKYGDRRYSNNSKLCIDYENNDNKVINDKLNLPMNSQSAYLNWEFHDKKTLKEITYVDNSDENESEEGEEDDNEIDDKYRKIILQGKENGNAIIDFDDEVPNNPGLENRMSDIDDSSPEEDLNSRASDNSSDSDDTSFNGGVYDPFRPDFININTTDHDKLVEIPPGSKFRDLTNLNYLGIRKLFTLENVRKYKNNLTTIISDNEKGEDYLITTNNSGFIIYSFDPITQMPNKKPTLKFETRPTFTSTSDRLISTWPYFPHTINFIKALNWMGKPVLGACVDDATLLIWFTDEIFPCIDKFAIKTNQLVSRGSYVNRINGHDAENDTDDNYNESNRFYGFKINPNFKLKMDASAWGLDFLSYTDSVGNDHNLIIASDNSQCISLFYYHKQDERFYHITSHQLLHNVPEVSFLDWNIDDSLDLHTIKVSCASISGELVIFSFSFRLNLGPLNKEEFEFFKNESIYYIDPGMAQMNDTTTDTEMSGRLPTRRLDYLAETELRSIKFPRIIFKSPVIVARTMLGEDCWTVKPINPKYFLSVQSIRAMTGDPWINENNELENIMNESSILDLQFDPVKTSHLGLSTCWQFFETPIVILSRSEAPHNIFESAKLTTIDDDYRRIHKGIKKIYKKTWNNKPQKSLNGKQYRLNIESDVSYENVLMVSTSKRVAIFRSDTLFCNTATKQVFDLTIPFSEDSRFSNRISITEIIPELLCFVVVSQQGLVSILRLCQHRGLYGMRQEHIFPNALMMALGYQGYRTIIGLATRNISLDTDHPRFSLYITYTDGVVVGYRLELNDSQDIIVANL